MHPVGPRSSGVYWVRRTLVAVVAVAVVAAVVWFVIGRSKGPGVDPASENSAGTGTGHMTGVLATDTSSSLPPVSSSDSASHGPGTSTASTKDTKASTATSTGAKATGSTKATGSKDGKTTTGKHHAGTTTTGKATATGKTAASTAGTGKTTGKTTATTSKTTTTTTTATTSTTSKATPTTTAPPKPSYDDQGRLLCPDSAITIKATTGEPSYSVGSQPILGMTVTNTGSKSCVRDLSGPLQVYTVYSKSGTRIWSTSDCFPGQGSDIRELTPGQTVPYNIKWSGTTSSPGCAAPRKPVAAGSYTVVAHLGDLKSAPRPFTITG